MMLRKRSAIPLYLLIAAAALAVAPSSLAAVDEEERAAQKEQALRQIVVQLEEASVRPVEEKTVEKEAQRILFPSSRPSRSKRSPRAALRSRA